MWAIMQPTKWEVNDICNIILPQRLRCITPKGLTVIQWLTNHQSIFITKQQTDKLTFYAFRLQAFALINEQSFNATRAGREGGGGTVSPFTNVRCAWKKQSHSQANTNKLLHSHTHKMFNSLPHPDLHCPSLCHYNIAKTW